ncbi:hypothetical protein DNTS_005304 [Danionella cerebrum]|uniref:DUF3715 domain-containing protein n=1 Tax=Danionella cerebrum TaxID=2873325 RepID=A0A553QHY8_9TELE|nr:hypothetical protein DNTS_005304 [Danionella translucida]
MTGCTWSTSGPVWVALEHRMAVHMGSTIMISGSPLDLEFPFLPMHLGLLLVLSGKARGPALSVAIPDQTPQLSLLPVQIWIQHTQVEQETYKDRVSSSLHINTTTKRARAYKKLQQTGNMEKGRNEEMLDGSRQYHSRLPGTLTLRNFIIPRKKRSSGEGLLEFCSEKSQDYKRIQTKLRNSMLETGDERINLWQWKEVSLVYNQELLKKFLGKRAEMRIKGRHGREMEEQFCFLAATDQMTENIYRHGLQIGNTTQHALGKPSHGVYLFMHVDVALKFASTSEAKKLIIFKVLYGKVKKVPPCLDWNKTQDPTLGFDCHMSKDPAFQRDTLDQQVLGSSVFLFDFNEKLELNERPRQCLPYAVVSFVPVYSDIQSGSIYAPLPFSKLPCGQVHDHFKACTVAERRGKRKNSTVPFKYFDTLGGTKTVYSHQNPKVHNPGSINSNTYWTPTSQLSESSSNSEQVSCHSNLFQSSLGGHTPPMQITDSTLRRNDNRADVIPHSPLEKISTAVYSPCFVTDPCLSGPNSYVKVDTVCKDLKCKPFNKSQEHKFTFGRRMTDSSRTDKKDCMTSRQEVHPETIPSTRILKKQFQGNSADFMAEEERLQSIWLQENMSPEQMQSHERCYPRYKKELLFQKETSSLSHIDPKVQMKKDHPEDAAVVKIRRGLCSTDIHENQHHDCPEPNPIMRKDGCLNSPPEEPLIPKSSNLNLPDSIQLEFTTSTKAEFSPAIQSAHELGKKLEDDLDENKSTSGANIVERPSSESTLSCGNCNPSCGENSCILSSVKQMQIGKSFSDIREVDSSNSGEELYKRFQLNELLQCSNPKQSVSSRPYLSPRVMSSPTNVISRPEMGSEDQAASNFKMKCGGDFHFTVTLKDTKQSSNPRETLSLSERFSKTKSLQKRLTKGKHKCTQTQGTPMYSSEGHDEIPICNAELIQLLAQKYNQSKINVKFKKCKRAHLKKRHTAIPPRPSPKRGKYVKTQFERAALGSTSETNRHSELQNQDAVPKLDVIYDNYETEMVNLYICQEITKDHATITDSKDKTTNPSEPSQSSPNCTENLISPAILLSEMEGEQEYKSENSPKQNTTSNITEDFVNKNELHLEISPTTSFDKTILSDEVPEDSTSATKPQTLGALTSLKNDLTYDTKCSNTHFHSANKSPFSELFQDSSELLRTEPAQADEANSAETHLISKLRDYLTKFESTFKKQDLVTDDLRERPLVWITLDSTAHKQQFFEKGPFCNCPCLEPTESGGIKKANSSKSTKRSVQTKSPQCEHAQTGKDLPVPEPKRVRELSQRSRRHRLRKGSVISVSPDSTSAIDCGPLLLAPQEKHNPDVLEISRSNVVSDQFSMQDTSITDQQKPSQYLPKSQDSESVTTIEMNDGGDVSSTLAEQKYTISDISDTLKKADQTVSMSELGSLQAKCKNMLQQFISSFEQDQKMPLNQTLVSRRLILEQYLDHAPAEIELKYEAVNSYLELQMMMETLQFVENKVNFLKGEPTFRSLLWYDPSLYGELFKGDVGFQQQSSLFASFQKILAEEGYDKLQEYYRAVSSLHHQLHVAPESSYYMFLKSKRELLEVEAALRNPHDMKSFFLSVPVVAMINFGDSLEKLEKIRTVMMTFVETPLDKLPGAFDVGKAEHLSITCRYLQEKAVFIRSSKEAVGKISWFGIEHLLYDASKVLVRQDRGSSAPREVLEAYKNANPQIIFGVMESRVAPMSKAVQPFLSVDGPTQQKDNNTQKGKALQKSSQLRIAQNIPLDKELAYTMGTRRVSYPPLMQKTMDSKGMNPIFQPSPATRFENISPYWALPHRPDAGHWEHGGTVTEWNAPITASTPHIYPDINSHPLPKRQRNFSHFGKKFSVNQHLRPQDLDPHAILQRDSNVVGSSFQTVMYPQMNTEAHFPQERGNPFSLAMTQPYSCPTQVSPSLSVQALTHEPVPSTIIHYPYFLMNGQTYTIGSQRPDHPEARYYPPPI